MLLTRWFMFSSTVKSTTVTLISLGSVIASSRSCRLFYVLSRIWWLVCIYWCTWSSRDCCCALLVAVTPWCCTLAYRSENSAKTITFASQSVCSVAPTVCNILSTNLHDTDISWGLDILLFACRRCYWKYQMAAPYTLLFDDPMKFVNTALYLTWNWITVFLPSPDQLSKTPNMLHPVAPVNSD